MHSGAADRAKASLVNRHSAGAACLPVPKGDFASHG